MPSARTTLRLHSRRPAVRLPGDVRYSLSKTVRSAAGMAQWLNFPISLLGQIVTFDVELQCSAERDIEYLNAFADGENWQPA